MISIPVRRVKACVIEGGNVFDLTYVELLFLAHRSFHQLALPSANHALELDLDFCLSYYQLI